MRKKNMWLHIPFSRLFRLPAIVLAIVISTSLVVQAQNAGGRIEDGTRKMGFKYSIALWDENTKELKLYLLSQAPTIPTKKLKQAAQARYGIFTLFKGKQKFTLFVFKFKENEDQLAIFNSKDLKSYSVTTYNEKVTPHTITYSLFAPPKNFSIFSFKPEKGFFSVEGSKAKEWRLEARTVVWTRDDNK